MSKTLRLERISERIFKIPGQMFYNNEVGVYVIDEPNELFIIDGPQKINKSIVSFIKDFNKPVKVILTHDATGGDLEALKKEMEIEILLHEADKKGEWLKVTPDRFIKEGENLTENLTVIHTPGHTKGSVCIYNILDQILFSGDTLEGDSKNDFRAFDSGAGGRGEIEVWKESLKKLLKLEIKSVKPFHYFQVADNIKVKLNKLISLQ